ncbi:MAG TPA: ABC transporter permease [Solirubrobacterales bacterium]|nr:ABC transporter permease [Solirubrobacterales bacterium]
MTPRDVIELVARRELTEGLRSRAWRAALLIQMLVVAGIAIVSIVTSGGSGIHTRHLATAGPRATAIAAKARTEAEGYGIKLEVEKVAGPAAAREKVHGEDADAALGPRGLTVGKDPDDALVALLQNAARTVSGEAKLRAAGLSPGAARAALEPPPLPTVEIATGEGEGGTGLAYIGALLLYVALISFGYAIASSVVAEKSSRVVEVILSAIRPVQLLAGKMIGVGILGLIQIAAVAAVGLVIAVPGGSISLPSSTFETVVLVLVYFVLGYVFYGGLFAASASLVSRQEDTQSTTGPILIILIASYLATNAALGNPSGGLATIGTFLPPMAPMVVPGRAAQGALPAGELIASLALMAAAIVVVIVLAARIYDRSVLRFGTPMKLREAIKIASRRS